MTVDWPSCSIPFLPTHFPLPYMLAAAVFIFICYVKVYFCHKPVVLFSHWEKAAHSKAFIISTFLNEKRQMPEFL